MKSIIALVCLVGLIGLSSEARPKRSVIYSHVPAVVSSAVVAAAPAVAVASVPVTTTSQVVHHNPTTVVKTEQVRSGDHASYSYSQQTDVQPVVHTQAHTTHVAVAAAPAAVVSHAHYAVPTAYGYYAHPYSYYSPYGYVLGK